MIRNTRQREVILDIINHSHSHPSAFEIYQECRKIIPNISLGTVYRNLNHLVQKNLIKKIGLDEEHCRYDHVEMRHSHFICRKCGKIVDVYENYFVDVKNIQGNIVSDYDISFTGICEACQKGG